MYRILQNPNACQLIQIYFSIFHNLKLPIKVAYTMPNIVCLENYSLSLFQCQLTSILFWYNRLIGRAVTRSSPERKVKGSNLGPVKSDTALPTARHRCNISLKRAVLPGRNDAEMGPANLLHASA